MSVIKKISVLDRRYLFILLLILSTIPILQPLGFPVPLSELTKKGYNFVQALPAGSVVIVDLQGGQTYGAELGSMYADILKHTFSRNLKVVIVGFEANAPLIYDMILKGSTITGTPINPSSYGKVYGTDYVFLGFIAGGETGFAAFARDSWVTQTDNWGTPLSNLPIMQYCKTVHDWSLMISISAGSYEAMIAQYYSAYQVPLIFGAPGVSASRLYPYVGAGQIVSILNSLRGSAEYELLTGQPGLAVSLMDMMSVSQLLIIACILIGNITYFISRGEGGK